MLELLWLIPALPFACSFALILFCGKAGRRTLGILGAGITGLSAVTATIVSLKFMASPPPGNLYIQKLWTWMQIGSWTPAVTLYLDPLSIIMILVVTWVSFLILVYSAYFMEHDEGFRRFFAYMNLFVGFMLVLVLSGDFLFLYLGWEGVGLCSYLLIGFWYREEANARAAFKAFLVTRIGDAALLVGLLVIFYHARTLGIQDSITQVTGHWQTGSFLVNMTAALLLGGAIGKSAQLPLQTWLPDAMAGPTPVSALIHASTMVTAGVYLIARTGALFAAAVPVQHAVAIIGSTTILIAGSSALVQRDIKRALAYSTMSQIGYMFLALGTGAWVAAVFHLMIHAFFKSLLFLCAGLVIEAVGNEHDVFRMGGLRARLPLVFWTFLIGAASMSAFPVVTGGFYSKELILLQVLTSPAGGLYLFLAGLIGSFITALYSFRLVFLVFFGKVKTAVHEVSSKMAAIPLLVLATLTIVGGSLQTPDFLGNATFLSDFLNRVSGTHPRIVTGTGKPLLLITISSVVSLAGIGTAYLFFLKRWSYTEFFMKMGIARMLHAFLYSGWGFDFLYNVLLIRPFIYLTARNRSDIIDVIFRLVESLSRTLYDLVRRTQSGNLRWYITAIAAGVILSLGLVIIL